MKTEIKRITVIVLDGFGVGAMPDASRFGDEGSDTMGGLCREVPAMSLPTLQRMGLGNLGDYASVPPSDSPCSFYGRMSELSPGKDTTTGHWEMMGLPVETEFPVFTDGFPPEIMQPFEQAIGRSTLGNKPASGTVIIEELGEEHMRTGAPIVYTSADSVFQVAAHEDVIPVPELYRICEVAREMLVGRFAVGRVIARPFVGEPGSFKRTYNRHDYSLLPFGPTLLNHLQSRGIGTHGIGKIGDIFAGQGLDTSAHTEGNADGMKVLGETLRQRGEGFLFVNLVDTDMNFGHRRNPQGYAGALEEFDQTLEGILPLLTPEDLLFITSDHGNDPTFRGTDHTREYVPLLAHLPARPRGQDLGTRRSFSDLAATIADLWSVPGVNCGRSFAEVLIDGS